MKMTLAFFKRFNSGTNPDDLICMDGYNKIAAQNYEEPFDYWMVMDDVKRWYANGEITRDHYRRWIGWLYAVRNSPETIEYWGNSITHDEFRFIGPQSDGITYESEALAVAARQAAWERHSPDVLAFANVLKVYQRESGVTTVPVSSLDEIVNGFAYHVHNPETGQFITCNGAVEALAGIDTVKGIEQNRFNLLNPIHQKISEPVDGFYAWKRIS